jgi:iron(III) transport system substrate-binding protein
MISRRTGLLMLFAVSAALLPGCGEAPEPAAGGARPQPVVVFAATGDDDFLSGLYEGYTEQTGVPVIVRRGAAAQIVNDVIENRITPAADILVTQSVADIQRAAEKGALRPMSAQTGIARVPAWLQDPDGYWTGVAYRAAVLAYDSASIAIDTTVDYAALADKGFDGRLCLSSSRNALNRAVIAMLIHAADVRSAELVVRGWVDNLAMPVFETDARLLDAIASGSCGVGMVGSSSAAGSALSTHTPTPAFIDIDAVGIGRHALNADGAAALVAWMLTDEAQLRLAALTASYPVRPAAGIPAALEPRVPDRISRQNVGLVAWYLDDAVRLAERARYP